MVRRAVPVLTPEQRRKRMLTYVGLGCGSLIVLGLATLLIGYLLLVSSPPVPKEVREALRQATSSTQTTQAAHATPTPSSPPTSPRPEQPAYPSPLPPQASAFPSAEAQIESIKQAIRGGYRGPVRVVITQDEINHRLANELSNELSAAKVVILDNRIAATAQLNFKGNKVDAYVEATPILEGTQPRVILNHAYVGRIPVPREQLQNVQAKLDEEIQRAVKESGYPQITGISTQAGRIIIDGYVSGQ